MRQLRLNGGMLLQPVPGVELKVPIFGDSALHSGVIK